LPTATSGRATARWGGCLLLLASSQWAAAQVPVGSEFLVNSYTTGAQALARVAAHSGGGFVVVWQSSASAGTDSSGYSIQARRFSSAGTATGSDFQVNALTTGDQGSPRVASDASGNFVVVWESPGGSIQARRFSSDGTPVGGEFQLNTTTSYPFDPAVAMEPDGDFVMTWAGDGIYGQRFASDGSALGGEFQVDTFTTLSSRSDPSIAVDADGDFVIAWFRSIHVPPATPASTPRRYGPDGTPLGGEFQAAAFTTDDWDIVARRYTSDGNAAGAEFVVNTNTASLADRPAVASANKGDFVVVWQSYGSTGTDTDGWSIQARRFASDGSGLGGEFQVNTLTVGDQNYPTVASASGSGFVVSWHSGPDIYSADVRARHFFETGGAAAEFGVHAATAGLQAAPDVAMAPNGDYVVVWTTDAITGDNDPWAIAGRRFTPTALKLFLARLHHGEEPPELR